LKLSKKQLYYLLKISGLVLFSLLLFLFISLYFYSSISASTAMRKKTEEMKAKIQIYEMETSRFVAPTAAEKEFADKINSEWTRTFSFPWTREEIARRVSEFVSLIEQKQNEYRIERLSMSSDNEIIKIILGKKTDYSPISHVRNLKANPDVIRIIVEYKGTTINGIRFAQDVISHARRFDLEEFDITRGKGLFFRIIFNLKKVGNE